MMMSIWNSCNLPTPSFYAQLLAARDSLYEHWLANPKAHTQCGTLIINILCNVIGVLDLRFLALYGLKCDNIFKPLPIAFKEVITRPKKTSPPIADS